MFAVSEEVRRCSKGGRFVRYDLLGSVSVDVSRHRTTPEHPEHPVTPCPLPLPPDPACWCGGGVVSPAASSSEQRELVRYRKFLLYILHADSAPRHDHTPTRSRPHRVRTSS
eukprot:scaffold483_cov107-Isochrysis_galbana.AAC.9